MNHELHDNGIEEFPWYRRQMLLLGPVVNRQWIWSESLRLDSRAWPHKLYHFLNCLSAHSVSFVAQKDLCNLKKYVMLFFFSICFVPLSWKWPQVICHYTNWESVFPNGVLMSKNVKCLASPSAVSAYTVLWLDKASLLHPALLCELVEKQVDYKTASCSLEYLPLGQVSENQDSSGVHMWSGTFHLESFMVPNVSAHFSQSRYTCPVFIFLPKPSTWFVTACKPECCASDHWKHTP